MVSQLDLSNNQLCSLDYAGLGTYTAEGITAIANAMRVNGALRQVLALRPPECLSCYSNPCLVLNVSQLDLSSNELCGLDRRGRGTYTAEGITAIADALRVNGGLTKISLAENGLGEEGTKAICEALEQNKTLKELDLSGGFPSFSNFGFAGGAAGAKHVAKMLGVNGALTECDLSHNGLGEEGNASIRFAAQGKAGFNLHL